MVQPEITSDRGQSRNISKRTSGNILLQQQVSIGNELDCIMQVNQEWGYSLHYGANRRWAQEGAFEGTFYDAFGVYGALTKINKDNSTIRLTAFYAPVDRGKSGPVTKEVVDLRSDPLYNPYWGYQEGENEMRGKAKVSSKKVPTVMPL
ncbi:MAG: hypothetical protein U0T81_02055 [Saprospiraceae bacterium]